MFLGAGVLLFSGLESLFVLLRDCKPSTIKREGLRIRAIISIFQAQLPVGELGGINITCIYHVK